MQDYKKLAVWERSHRLAVTIYNQTNSFPKEEKYGIILQLRRAALSVPTNIVEGCGREGSKDLNRFLSIAMGSASEVEYLLCFTRDIGLMMPETYEQIVGEIVEIKKMLAALQKKVRA